VLACEPLRQAGDSDFLRTDLPARIRDAVLALSTKKGAWHTPPADAIFLHRKLNGAFLPAARLKARVNVQAPVQRHRVAVKAPQRRPRRPWRADLKLRQALARSSVR
jgi:hypothetical protein